MPKNRERHTTGKTNRALAESTHVDELTQVRSILFGQEASEIDARLAAIEALVAAQAEEQRRTIHERLEALEDQFNQELQRIGDQIAREKQARASALVEKGHEIQASAKALEKRMAKLESQRTAGERELRKRLGDQSKTLLASLKQQSQQLTSLIEGHVSDFAEAKLDRDAFSRILADAAAQVSLGTSQSHSA